MTYTWYTTIRIAHPIECDHTHHTTMACHRLHRAVAPSMPSGSWAAKANATVGATRAARVAEAEAEAERAMLASARAAAERAEAETVSAAVEARRWRGWTWRRR